MMYVHQASQEALSFIPGHEGILKSIEEIKAALTKSGGKLNYSTGVENFCWKLEDNELSISASLQFDLSKLH